MIKNDNRLGLILIKCVLNTKEEECSTYLPGKPALLPEKAAISQRILAQHWCWGVQKNVTTKHSHQRFFLFFYLFILFKTVMIGLDVKPFYPLLMDPMVSSFEDKNSLN